MIGIEAIAVLDEEMEVSGLVGEEEVVEVMANSDNPHRSRIMAAADMGVREGILEGIILGEGEGEAREEVDGRRGLGLWIRREKPNL